MVPLGLPASRASFREIRARSRRLFEQVIREEAYYERPIALRHPVVFYEGHLPAFAVNTLVKWALGRPGVDESFEALFERGIDPPDEARAPAASAWPKRARIQEFARLADERVEQALGETGDRVPLAVGTILEHELMHQETLLYMLHRLPPERLRAQGPRPRVDSGAPLPGAAVHIPAGCATLGAGVGELSFGWDNEFPRLQVEVPAFEIDALPVTNADYLEFVEADPPLYWERREGAWHWRAFFDWIPLPLTWPVYVSHAEASAYCRFRGRRLPTEAEFHRAAYGTPEGRERAHPWGEDPPQPGHHGNFGLVSWDPWPVGSCPAGGSAFGVHELVGNGWEWTSSPFQPFPGFTPMPSYPAYSTDFFDGQHYVLKGASPGTAPELVRRSFRNWYRSRYPYPYAKLRTVAL